MSKIKIFSGVLAFSFLVLVGPAISGPIPLPLTLSPFPPDSMNISGVLMNQNNAPYTGNVDLEFLIYKGGDWGAGGVQVWDKTYSNNTLDSKGYFSVPIGGKDIMNRTFPIFENTDFVSGTPYYLRIAVRPTGQSWTMLNPGQKLVTSPYAFQSKNAIFANYAEMLSAEGGGVSADDFVKKTGDMMSGKLQIFSAASESIYAFSSVNAITGNSSGSNQAGLYGYSSKSDGFGVIGNNANGTAIAGYSTSGYGLQIFANKNYFSGNVGIGTTNPMNLLSLGVGLGKKLAVYNNSDGTDFYGLGIEAGRMNVWAGSKEVMNISNTGYVGIGTANPSYKLDVSGRMRSVGAFFDINNSSGLWLTDTMQINNGFVGTSGNKQIGLWGSGANWGLVMNTDNGTVGIGTTAPDNSGGTKLDVNGGLKLNGGIRVASFGFSVVDVTANKSIIQQGWDDSNGDWLYLGTGGADTVQNNIMITEKNGALINNGRLKAMKGTDTNGLTVYDGMLVNNGTVNLKNIALPSSGVNGTVKIRDWGGLYGEYPTSSLRYKHDIKDYSPDTSKILGLRPVTFKYNEDAAIKRGFDPNNVDIGLIAEELAKNYPEFVAYDPKGQPDSINYDKLPILFISAIKDLMAKNKELEKRIQELENRSAK